MRQLSSGSKKLGELMMPMESLVRKGGRAQQEEQGSRREAVSNT